MAYSGTELLVFGFWLLRDWRVVEKGDRDIRDSRCVVEVLSDEGIATLRRAGRATIFLDGKEAAERSPGKRDREGSGEERKRVKKRAPNGN